MSRSPSPPWLGPGMVARRLVVTSADAILVKALVEGHEGVAAVFGETGGDLTIAAPQDRERELDELVQSISDLISNRTSA